MSEEKSLKSPSRRAFFTKAGAGAVGVAAVGLSAKSAQTGVKSDTDLKKNNFKKSLYRETEHVKRYNELARL